jgi:hypothetical protein
MALAARAKDDGEGEETADQAEAEVIQRAAVDCLRRMLGQPASRLNVKDLDDLGLLQRDLDRMKARMMPRGRKRERARQDSPTEGRVRRKRTKATASKVKYHPPNLALPPFGQSQHLPALWLWPKSLGL